MEGHFGKRLTGFTHVAGAGEQQGHVSVLRLYRWIHTLVMTTSLASAWRL